MVSKEELLKCSVANFTKFGSKRFTMDQLAQTLGISKKTIYLYYDSKEDLVVASISHLVNDFKQKVNEIIDKQQDPLICIILIYELGFDHLKYFKPSFIFGLKKYYPKANKVFDDFREYIVHTKIFRLLEIAQKSELIASEVNLTLFCDLYFNRFEDIVFKNVDLFENYSNKELLIHFVIYNLKGISSNNYSNPFFQQIK